VSSNYPPKMRQIWESPGLVGRVLLVRGGPTGWICGSLPITAARASRGPQADFRGQRSKGPEGSTSCEQPRLLYAALGVDLSFGEREDGGGDLSRPTSRLRKGAKPITGSRTRTSRTRQRDADRLFDGRPTSQAKEVDKVGPAGNPWIAGGDGIGKYFLWRDWTRTLAQRSPQEPANRWALQGGRGHPCIDPPSSPRHQRLAAWEMMGTTGPYPIEDETDLQRRLTRS